MEWKIGELLLYEKDEVEKAVGIVKNSKQQKKKSEKIKPKRMKDNNG